MQPKKIVWLIPGVTEGDSMISLISSRLYPNMPDDWRSVENVLITNSKSFKDFKCDTYFAPDHLVPGRARAETSRDLTMSAYREGLLNDYDMLITTQQMSMILPLFLRTQKNPTKNDKPTVIIWPKVPEGTEIEFSPVTLANPLYWWLHSKANWWSLTLDNPTEADMARKFLTHEGSIHADESRVIDLVCYKWGGFLQTPNKNDEIIWQGRFNGNKRPDLALQILTLLSARGHNSRAFIPSISMSYTHKLKKLRKGGPEIITNLDRSLYQKEIATAKAFIISSEVEGWPPGYFEMIERRAIPVIRERPWMKTFLTEKWPLVWTKIPEAVQMAEEAVENYDYYLDLLDKCLQERYSKEPNFWQVLNLIWEDYEQNCK